MTDQTSDRRKAKRDVHPSRRYEDVKAAASTAAERIEQATKTLCKAFRDHEASQGAA